MRTSKAVSTISYNSEEFLKQKLDELMSEGVIEFYAFIKHKAEEDEENDHIHLYMQPMRYINTEVLLDRFIENDASNNRCFRCICMKTSKFDDWYLYAKHDRVYLSSKGQRRIYHYEEKDFYTSDALWLLEMVRIINRGELELLSKVVNAYKNRISFETLVVNYEIPISRYRICEDLYNRLANCKIEELDI